MAAIYQNLSDEAKAAHERWNDALIARAEHAIGCPECSAGRGDCGIGIRLSTAEQRIWTAWHQLRRLERGNA